MTILELLNYFTLSAIGLPTPCLLLIGWPFDLAPDGLNDQES